MGAQHSTRPHNLAVADADVDGGDGHAHLPCLEVVTVILDCKRDVWKNTELFDLVEDYIQNSLQTLNFYTILEKCLTKARDNQLILQVALQCFAEEEEDHKGDNARNSRTLMELRHFKVADDPFTEEYSKREDATNHLNTTIETCDLEGIEKYNKRTVKVLEELRLTMDQFIDLCILSGCDCYDNIKDMEDGLGLKRKQLIAIALLAGNDHDLHGVPRC
ncbi:hypothetical protein ZIOFF_069270 [Zingiber officinale]|uniref:Uncharacterized protein n=1 Tax=Zingiber officinale TaxID=94328 RepID=A0A8J5C3M1_ZINOF|nr:hypothetical protein ZIOFF_069270 [Zingiber officinale]